MNVQRSDWKNVVIFRKLSFTKSAIMFLFSYFKRNEIFKDLRMLWKCCFRIHAQIERMECWHAWKIGFVLSKTTSSGDYFGIGFVTGWIFRFWKNETFRNHFTCETKNIGWRWRNHMTDSNIEMNWMVAMKKTNWKQIRKFRKTNVAVGSWSMENGQNLTGIGAGSRYKKRLSTKARRRI